MYCQRMWLTAFYCFKSCLCGLCKEKLLFSYKVMMQQLLGENLYFVSHTKQGKIMMTVDFEHQNLRIAGSQVTFLY